MYEFVCTYILLVLYIVVPLPKRPDHKNLNLVFAEVQSVCSFVSRVDLKGYDFIVRGVVVLLFCFTKNPTSVVNYKQSVCHSHPNLEIFTEICNPYIFLNIFFLIYSEFTGLTHSDGGSRMDSLPKKWGKSVVVYFFTQIILIVSIRKVYYWVSKFPGVICWQWKGKKKTQHNKTHITTHCDWKNGAVWLGDWFIYAVEPVTSIKINHESALLLLPSPKKNMRLFTFF